VMKARFCKIMNVFHAAMNVELVLTHLINVLPALEDLKEFDKKWIILNAIVLMECTLYSTWK